MDNAIPLLAGLALLVIVYHYGPTHIRRTRNLDRGQTDYFKLSGVPPPTPLVDFKLEKAKPRPYRPFRWEYHQNMGKPNCVLSPHSFMPPLTRSPQEDGTRLVD